VFNRQQQINAAQIAAFNRQQQFGQQTQFGQPGMPYPQSGPYWYWHGRNVATTARGPSTL